MADDGYYLLLAPLSAGQHQLHFGATFPNSPGTADDFILDITYNLTVTPRRP